MTFLRNIKEEKDELFKIEGCIYEKLFNTFPDFVLLLDLEGRIVDISQMVLKLYLAEKKDDFIGKRLLDFIVPEEQESAKQTFHKVLNEGSIRMVEYKFIKKNNTTFIGELSISVLNDKEDQKKFLFCIMRDITNQKMIEEELTQSQNMLQLVMDNIPQFIYWKDIYSAYLGCNKNFARVAGVGQPENIVGKTDYDLAWKRDEAEFSIESDHLIIDTDNPEYHIIESQLQANGKHAWLDTNKIPLHNSSGEVIGILGTYEDITDRINAEIALKDSEMKYRHLFERAPFMIVLSNMDGKIVDLNNQVFTYTGYKKEELLGKNMRDLSEIIPQKYFPFIIEIYRDLLTKGFLKAIEVQIYKKDKSLMWISLQASLLEIGKKLFIELIIQDYTEKKKSENLIIEEIEKLKKLDSLKTELITRISHELKTPLVSICAATEFLLDHNRELLDDRVIDLIESIRRGGDRLKQLVYNLIDVSKIESNKLTLHIKNENLRDIVRDCFNDTKVSAFKRDINFKLNHLEDICIEVDKVRIEQVIMNLLLNAIKNTPPKGTVSVSLQKTKNHIDIIIKDTGVGLTEEEKKIIFKKFGKIERYGKGLDVDIEGSGLGLYISKKIIELHGGEIWVESEGKDKGSTFYFTLPLIKN